MYPRRQVFLIGKLNVERQEDEGVEVIVSNFGIGEGCWV
jgi:hypothetical protein